jgi:hypothetical protein
VDIYSKITLSDLANDDSDNSSDDSSNSDDEFENPKDIIVHMEKVKIGETRDEWLLSIKNNDLVLKSTCVQHFLGLWNIIQTRWYNRPNV